MNRSVLRLLGALAVSVVFAACSDAETNENACYDPLAAGCGQGGAGGAGGAGDTCGAPGVQPTTFLEAKYTAGSVDYAWAWNHEITCVSALAKAFDWTAVEAASKPGTLIAEQLNALEVEFSTGAEAKKRSPKALFTLGLSIGKTSGGDATKNALALQHIEKSLLVLTELYAFHELAEAVAATVPADATKEIDAAVIMFATLEARFIKRSASEVKDLWGAGSTLITNDGLAAKTGEMFAVAREKYATAAPDAKAALEAARVYATKYYYASVLNYANVVATDLAAGATGEVAMVEGGTFSEGLSTGFFGTSDVDAAPMRGLWTGPAAGVTVAAMRPVAIGVYAKLTTKAASYYTLPEQPELSGMLVSAGQIQGSVEVLSEALTASGADLAALRMKAADLVAKSAANDLASAAPLAAELDAAIALAVK